MCFLYIPPSTLNWFESGQASTFDSLQEDCANYENKGWLLLFGAMNAGTSSANDFIADDDDFLHEFSDHRPHSVARVARGRSPPPMVKKLVYEKSPNLP